MKRHAKRRAVKPARGRLPRRLGAKLILRLFVAGATARSRQAVLRVRELCENESTGAYTLEVVDIYQQPALARANQIVATPTLIKEFPRPVRRFIGNMADVTALAIELEAGKKSSQASGVRGRESGISRS